MKALDHRTMAHLDVVLEEACRSLPHGGDHATRKKIAQRLLASVRKGNVTIDGLSAVARDALDRATKRARPGGLTDTARSVSAGRRSAPSAEDAH